MRWPWRPQSEEPDVAFVLIDFLNADDKWLDCSIEPLVMWAAKRELELPPGTTRILLHRTDSAA